MFEYFHLDSCFAIALRSSWCTKSGREEISPGRFSCPPHPLTYEAHVKYFFIHIAGKKWHPNPLSAYITYYSWHITVIHSQSFCRFSGVNSKVSGFESYWQDYRISCEIVLELPSNYGNGNVPFKRQPDNVLRPENWMESRLYYQAKESLYCHDPPFCFRST